MNNFNQEKLPERWEVKSLADIGNIFSGNSINAKLKEEKYTNKEGTPYVATKDISYNSVINYDNGINIPFDDVNKFRLAKSETILICAEGGSAGRKVGILNQDVYFVNKLFALETISEVNSKFCFYWCLSKEFKSNFKDKLKGLIGGVSKTDFKNLPIPLPQLKEQKRIVAKIDTLFAKIDKAISLTEESLKQAKKLLPSAVRKLFEDGEAKGWKKLKFKDFASLRHGHQFRKYDYVDNGIPVVKIGQCIPGDRLDLTKCNFIDKSRETEFSNDLIYKGDLLMALTGGTLGKVTWVKDDYGVVVQNYRVGNFFTDEKLSSKRFLMYALLSPIFQTLMYSKINVAAQPNIGKEEIENLEFVLPSLEEQSKVVDRLDDLTSKAKQTQSKLEEQLAYLKQLKSSILSKAFQGEL